MIKKQWNKFAKIHLNKNKTWFIFLINKLNIYKTIMNINIDDAVFEIQKIICTIIKIWKKLKSKDFILILILINAINEKCYVMTKWQLKNMNNFIFIDIIEKYKKMKQKIRDNYTSLKIEIANRTISNETRVANGSKRKHLFWVRSEIRRITDWNFKICFRSVGFKYMKRKFNKSPIAQILCKNA